MSGQVAGGHPRVSLQFFLPPEDLRPFLSTFYSMKVTGSRNEPVRDRLHPEWTNLRYFPEGACKASVGEDEPMPIPPLSLTGPTSRNTRFEALPSHSWGIGILPLGLARLTPLSARQLADRISDPFELDELAGLRRLEPIMAREDAEPAQQVESLAAAMRELLAAPARREDAIVRVQAALVDPQTHSVADLAHCASMSTRTLERFCRDAFGFSPQLLLRRQRFLRSLAQFMLDPSMKWLETLDQHYTDQAHFVRDFRFFMTMTPSEYAALDHPVLSAAAKARMAAAGEAMQVLQRPAAPSHRKEA
ncbi:helix-turn-helix domain-containing protein [Qipengyuania aurantiaca]|uniref:Helix-turn-helix domain-containing protein n=1 Tax=Qipengyuania aurantiaca TaxID=2867233 RepID=A0ABX8ZPN1_9SPHN|nr:helix-turn-helix domain-containing protein [Qipengyuania aurantiaca]QZD90691.1 helix-turn-helix domain-containing protein [Qipengyuania aurantiaca]